MLPSNRARAGHGSDPNRRRFIVEFSSSRFTEPAAIAGISAAASTSKGKITEVRLTPHLERKSLRVLFELDPGGETLCELHLVLIENGKIASETWLYRWTS